MEKIKIRVERLPVYAVSDKVAKHNVVDAFVKFEGEGKVLFKVGNRGSWSSLPGIYKPSDLKVGRRFYTRMASQRWEIDGVY